MDALPSAQTESQSNDLESTTAAIPKTRKRSRSTSSRGSQYEGVNKKLGSHKSRRNEVFFDAPERLDKTIEDLFVTSSTKYIVCKCSDCTEKKKRMTMGDLPTKAERDNCDSDLYDSPVKDKSVQQKVGDASIIDKDIQTRISLLPEKEEHKKIPKSVLFHRDDQKKVKNSVIIDQYIQTIQAKIVDSILKSQDVLEECPKNHQEIVVNYVSVPTGKSFKCLCDNCKCSECLDSSKKSKSTSSIGGGTCTCQTCKCNPCADPSKSKQSAGDGGQCTCPTCKCNPCADPNKSKQSGGGGGSSTKCTCQPCKCNPCADPDKSKQSGGGGGSSANCTCPTCKCNPCADPNKSKQSGGGGGTGTKCTCQSCKCNPCADPDKSKQSGGGGGSSANCTCPTCKCNPCADPNKSKQSGGGGGTGTKCTCQSCKCNPCADPDKSKQSGGGGKSGGACTCPTCKCNPCADPDKSKQSGGGGAKCTCPTCKCNPCADPDKSKQSGGGGGDKPKQLCKCGKCNCADCADPNVKSQKSGSKKDDNQTCGCVMGCVCVDCKLLTPKKPPREIIPAPCGNIKICKCRNCGCGRIKDDPKGNLNFGKAQDCNTVKCDCNYCKPCSSTTSTQAKPSGTSMKSSTGGCKCGAKCLCTNCQFGGGQSGAVKGVTSVPVIPATKSSVNCTCPVCKCQPCADSSKSKGGGGGGDKSKCHCQSCQCKECEFKKGGAGGKTCDCKTCTCPVCTRKSGESKSQTAMKSSGSTLGCTCKNCTCPICSKKGGGSGGGGGGGGSTTKLTCKCDKCACGTCQANKGGSSSGKGGIITESSIGCACKNCTCPICSKKGAGGGGKGESGCTCKPNCTCPSCSKKGGSSSGKEDKGGITTKASIGCACKNCTCPICSKKGAGGGGKGEGGCTCKPNCTCPSCSKKGGSSSGKEDKGGIITKASIGCACKNCTCPICSKKGAAGGGGGKGESGCTCKPNCTCPSCSKKGGSSSGKEDKGGIITKASIGCACKNCTCPICSKKGAAGGAGGKGESGCTCKPNCTCPSCSKKGGSSSGKEDKGGITTKASIGCACKNCTCPICSKKGAGGGKGESGGSTTKLTCKCDKCVCSTCLGNKGAGGGGKGESGCTCKPNCTCPSCSKKGGSSSGKGDKGGIITEASIGCACKNCTCPVCSKKGAGGGGKGEGGCTCKPNCTCPSCSKKGGSSSGKGDKGGIITEASIGCACKTCTCAVCSKKGAGGGGKGEGGCTCKPNCTCPSCSKKGGSSGGKGDKGGIITEASIGCACKNCTCAVCSKKGAGGGGKGEGGCTCKPNCTCPSCSKKGGSSGGKGDKGGIITEASIGCACKNCTCPVCSKKGAGGGGKPNDACKCKSKKTGTDSGPAKLQCNCKPCCTCLLCTRKPAGGGVPPKGCKCKSKKTGTSPASRPSSPAPAPCKCPPKSGTGGEGTLMCNCKTCTCPVCTKKPGGGGSSSPTCKCPKKSGMGEGATLTCNCTPKCTCPVCSKKPGGGGGAAIPCTCPPKKPDAGSCECPVCKCSVCPQKPAGSSTKITCKCAKCTCLDCFAKRAEQQGSGGDDEKCKCKACSCKECSKGGGGGMGCTCTVCTCPVCSKKGIGGGVDTKSKCLCGSVCKCVECSLKAGTKVYFCSMCTSDLPPSLSHYVLGSPIGKIRVKFHIGSTKIQKSKNLMPGGLSFSNSQTISVCRDHSDNYEESNYETARSTHVQGFGDASTLTDLADYLSPDANSNLKCRHDMNKCTACCSYINVSRSAGRGDDSGFNPTVQRVCPSEPKNCDVWELLDGKEKPEDSDWLEKTKEHIMETRKRKDRSKSIHKKLAKERSGTVIGDHHHRSQNRKRRSKSRKCSKFDEIIDLSLIPPFTVPKRETSCSENCDCFICMTKRPAIKQSILKSRREWQKIYRSKATVKDSHENSPEDLSTISPLGSPEYRKSSSAKHPKRHPSESSKDRPKSHSNEKSNRYNLKLQNAIEDRSSSQISQDRSEDISFVEQPLIKQAPEFSQTMSGLKLAFDCLEKKGKAKDQLIEALSEALRTLNGDNSCETFMSINPSRQAPDYDRTEDLKLLENCLRYPKGRALSAPPSRLKKSFRNTSPSKLKQSLMVSDDSVIKEKQIQQINYETSNKELNESRSSERFPYSNDRLACFFTNSRPSFLSEQKTVGDWRNDKQAVKGDTHSKSSTFGSLDYQSKSSIQTAIKNLRERCKAKDTLIKAAAEELRKSISNSTLLKILAVIPGATELPPQSKKEKDSLERKFGEANRTGTPKLRKKVPSSVTKSSKPHKDANSRINVAGFEITNVTRVTVDSLIVKWVPPPTKAICGYDILVNGRQKNKVMSGSRTCTMIHSIDFSTSIFIAVYAVTASGRVEPPATAIFELQSKA